VRRFDPEVVVGLGGYSSGPVVAAGWWRNKPTLIIEPNAYPGLTNRWLARVADRAALASPEALRYFEGIGVVTGIPVRAEFHRVPRKAHRRGELTLLIYGGSQGSRALNRAVCASLPLLQATRLRIIHQTGETHLEEVRAAYAEARIEAEIRPFLPRIYEDFARVDLLLCRAGAGTVAELAAAGKAALLVPFPKATDDHQTKNAEALQKAGAARMIAERELTPERLVREIEFFSDHPEEIFRMEESARALSRPDAAARIADLIIELAKN
jgi:UDP-N-acetylglucosamine--N-acetylmuramyl-(pentapeptide) pyrophosphoryl-undecaprenol N-acetylglucosamine transferase